MPQHAPMRQQILTLDLLAARLSVSSSSLHPYFSNKPELIRQLVSFILIRIRQPTFSFAHHSLTDELRDLLATYRELFTAFSQNALFDLKRLYPEEWGSIMELRESQWQRIAATINSGIASGQLLPVDTNLVQIKASRMLLDPFRRAPPSLAELLDILLFYIARHAP